MVRESLHCPQEACNDAADQAVKKVFAILGVDIDDPAEVETFRRDLRFASSLREAAVKGILAVVGTIAVAAVSTLWYGIVTSIKGGN